MPFSCGPFKSVDSLVMLPQEHAEHAPVGSSEHLPAMCDEVVQTVGTVGTVPLFAADDAMEDDGAAGAAAGAVAEQYHSSSSGLTTASSSSPTSAAIPDEGTAAALPLLASSRLPATMVKPSVRYVPWAAAESDVASDILIVERSDKAPAGVEALGVLETAGGGPLTDGRHNVWRCSAAVLRQRHAAPELAVSKRPGVEPEQPAEYRRRWKALLLVLLVAVPLVLLALDLQTQFRRAAERRRVEVAECRHQFHLNRCEPHSRAPALAGACADWEACFAAGEKIDHRVLLTAGYTARIVQVFTEELSWRSVLVTVTFGVAVVIGAVAVSFFKLSTATPPGGAVK